MTRTIVITSGKGGVGKTTLTTNLAYALTELGHTVTVMDTNLTTPNLGLHLGLHLTRKSLHDVLKGKVSIKGATYTHPYGFKVVPASLNINALTGVDPVKLKNVVSALKGNSDFIIMDSAAGLGREALSSIDAADEILIITNPDLPSVVDALRTIKLAEAKGKKVTGIVVNRRAGKHHELTLKEIEEMLSVPVLVEIPEDKTVHRSIATKKPLLEYDPESPASYEIRRLAYYLSRSEYPDFPHKSIKPRFPFLSRLIEWMIK